MAYQKGRKIVNARKMTIDGITFASMLEGHMYKLLKEAGVEFTYEGTKFQIFDPDTYDAECWERATRNSRAMINRSKVAKITYTPDFVGKNEEWIIETKGRANERFPLVWKMFKRLMMQKPGKTAILFKPAIKADCQQVIDILREKGYAKK